MLCLAYSPMMVPAHGGGREAATPPPRSPPDVGGRVSGGEKGKHGASDPKASAQSADEGVGAGVSSVGMSSASPFSASAKITDQEEESKANVRAVGGGEAGGEAAAAAVMSVSSWEAVDPLDPAAATEKMLSLSFMSSLSSMATPPTAVDGTAGSGGSGGIGFRPDADEHKAGGTKKNGVLPPPPSFSTGGGWAHPRRDGSGTPLVLLASASRDRLVHIFDASLSSSCGGRGAGAATTAAASASAFLKSDGGLRVVGGGAGGVTAVGQARVGAREGLGGLDARLSGKVAAMNAGVEADIAAAGFPLLKTLDSHSGSVTAVKFTRDGKRCAGLLVYSLCVEVVYHTGSSLTTERLSVLFAFVRWWGLSEACATMKHETVVSASTERRKGRRDILSPIGGSKTLPLHSYSHFRLVTKRRKGKASLLVGNQVPVVLTI